MIAVLLVLGALAALLAAAASDAPAARSPARSHSPRWSLLLAGTVIAAASAAARGRRARPRPNGSSPSQSNRSAYWRVAAEVFAEHPLNGIGSGSFGVEWLQRREIAEAVRDAHSLYLETAAELGLVGLARAGRAPRRHRPRRPQRRANPRAVAALAAFALHAGLDWDWELPALSLVAILLAARVIAAQEP